jgi:hypothetical protein
MRSQKRENIAQLLQSPPLTDVSGPPRAPAMADPCPTVATPHSPPPLRSASAPPWASPAGHHRKHPLAPVRSTDATGQREAERIVLVTKASVGKTLVRLRVGIETKSTCSTSMKNGRERQKVLGPPFSYHKLNINEA